MAKWPRALLLDLDNTVYAYEPCHQAGVAAAHRIGARLHPAWQEQVAFASDFAAARIEVKRTVGRQAAAHSRLLYFKQMVEQRFQRTRLRASQELEAAYWNGYGTAMRLDPGCREVLEQLQDRRVRLAWVTNYTTARQMWKLRQLALDCLPGFLVTSEEAGAEKPDPATIDLALLRLRLRPDDVRLVGDSLSEDLAAAHTRHIPALWYRREAPLAGMSATSAATWPEVARWLGGEQ